MGLQRVGHRECGRARVMVRERERNRLQAIAVEQCLSHLAGDDTGRTVAVLCDDKVRWTNLSERGLTGKEFQAGLLGSEPRRDASRSTGSVTRVFEFFRGKDPQEVLPGGLAKQPVYAREIHGVDTTARERNR